MSDIELLDKLEVVYLKYGEKKDKVVIGEKINLRRLKEILRLYDKMIKE